MWFCQVFGGWRCCQNSVDKGVLNLRFGDKCRFPRKVAEALCFETVDKIEFTVTIQLPDAKPEDSEITLRLIRK